MPKVAVELRSLGINRPIVTYLRRNATADSPDCDILGTQISNA